MKEKAKLKVETYGKAPAFRRIGNRAARKAQEGNRRPVLPNVYSHDGKIIYEMPDGGILVKDLPPSGAK